MTQVFSAPSLKVSFATDIPPGLVAAYAPGMLGRLQNRRGEPTLRIRLLAGLVVVGLIVLTAPLIVLPIAHWIARLV